jgi:hypothetical protein
MNDENEYIGLVKWYYQLDKMDNAFQCSSKPHFFRPQQLKNPMKIFFLPGNRNF